MSRETHFKLTLTAALLAGGLAALGAAAATQTPAPAAVSMIEPEGDAQKYWPRWRGPSGQGLVRGSGYPDRWSAQDSILWKTAVPGRGHSSPIIWGDRIFITTAQEEGNRRSLLCFRRSDGKLLWEASAPSSTLEKIYWKNSYASSTPVTDGQSVYAYFGNQGLLSVDMEGKQQWHRSLGQVTPLHGPAGSPLLYRDRLILLQESRGAAGSFVAAFSKNSGETIWWTKRSETLGWGTPIAIQAGSRHEIIVSSQHRVYAYDPDNGGELWSCAGNLVEVIPTPVVGHGLLFCSSGRAGPTLAIRPGGSGDVTESRVVWQSPKGSPFVPSPLLYGENLYMVNDMTSVATCFEARTGRVLWQGRLGEVAKESFSASPVGVDGKVFFTNDMGETFVLRAGPQFELLHVNRLEERVLASPALVDGKWYFRTEGHLIAIGS